MRKTHMSHSFGTIMVLLIAATAVFAQVASTGGVLGTVTDPSGAVVPGATVTLTNIDTGITSSATTNETGNYTFPLVPVGRYDLAVEKPGFKKFLQSGFAINAAQNVRLNAALSVGTVTEAVTTTAEPPAVDTVTASQGNTVSGQQATTLPLTNRVFTQLVMLEPGVAAPLDQSPGFGSNSQVLFNMNGVRSDENNLTVDGLRNLDTFGGNAFIAPNLFAISEFRVENNSYSAATGRNAGGQVNLVTRSGTNAFHGNVFEYFRNDALNAKDYFATSVPENRYNDFGYDLGGPIKKDRIFFFWSQEWRRIIQSAGTQVALVPTAAERAGDFSALLQGPSPVVLTNPATGNPYPGNIIPPSQIDHNASLLLQNYFPMPTPGFQQGVFNFVSSAPDFTRWREESIRVDGKISSKLSAYVRLTQDSATLENP
ncbi:MAG TPA: TonB-dependent receptor, partial [Terriglobales bacterium]|nr:TonB-dependent receptor [Terriglobales bacterium]